MLFDEDDQPIRIMTIDEDLTDRKRADSELLAMTEIDESRKDQVRFKDECLSHVSQQMRPPLDAIKQFTTILLSGVAGPLNDDQHEYQVIVQRSVQQIQAMLDELLEVARLETGKLTVETGSASVSRSQGVAVSCPR